MVNNLDVNIRLGDFNSPTFYLIGTVCSRTRVLNFTADFPCDVGDSMGANCKNVNLYNLILPASPEAKNIVSHG